MSIWHRIAFLVSLAGAVIPAVAADRDGELVAPAGPSTAPAIVKPRIDDDAIGKFGFRLGVQAWTFRELSVFETIDVLKALGVHYLELYPGQRLSREHAVPLTPDLPQERIDELLARCRQSGVTLVNLGVIALPGNEAGARKVFDFARKLGLETIVSEPHPDKATFDVIEKLAEEYKINVAMHDHPRPSTYWDPDTVLRVCEGRSPRLGGCADVGHWYRSGLSPVECVRKLRGRVISVHLKDVNEAKTDVPWGEGKVDAKGIMAELKEQGAKPIFSIEYESSRGPALIANVARCCENFSTMAEEMGRE